MADQVGLSQSALSQHLARLRNETLVGTRREAQTIYYTLRSTGVLAVLFALDDVFGRRIDEGSRIPSGAPKCDNTLESLALPSILIDANVCPHK
jgi:hypothetical protein